MVVFRQKTQSVVLRRDGRVIRGSVIYATPKGVPFDIAVIVSRPTANSENITPCQISGTTHAPGKWKINTGLFIFVRILLLFSVLQAKKSLLWGMLAKKM